MIKVVLDTNIYLSGIIFGGNPRHILDLVIARKISAFISPAILFEISQKLEKKFRWDKKRILVTIKTIALSATVVFPEKKLEVVKEDKSDNKILEAGYKANADFIITGDSHLLKIKKFQKTKILSPAEFLSVYFKK